MTTEELAFFSTAVSVLALLVAVFSTFAAFRSAGVAGDAEKRASRLAEEGAARELQRSRARLKAEIHRADRLLFQTEVERKAIAIHTGNLGVSRHKLYESFVREQRLELEDIQADSANVSGDPAAQQIALDGALVRVLATKELAAMEYASLRGERHMLMLKAPAGQ